MKSHGKPRQRKGPCRRSDAERAANKNCTIFPVKEVLVRASAAGCPSRRSGCGARRWLHAVGLVRCSLHYCRARIFSQEANRFSCDCIFIAPFRRAFIIMYQSNIRLPQYFSNLMRPSFAGKQPTTSASPRCRDVLAGNRHNLHVVHGSGEGYT